MDARSSKTIRTLGSVSCADSVTMPRRDLGPSSRNCIKPTLSAVIVQYGEARHLTTCLSALEQDPGIAEIIVVDNMRDGCAQDTVDRLRSRARVIRPSTNLGFGGGANLGASFIAGDKLVFLNPDTIPEPGCMTALARHLSEWGGVAGPLVRTGPDGEIELGCTVDRMLLPRALHTVVEPLFVQGCCLATTRTCFDALAGFDDRYFLFQEDVEFCWQALRRGFNVDVVADATIIHAGGTSAIGGYRRSGRIETSSSRILLRERNGWALLLACVPLRQIPMAIALSALRTTAFAALLITNGRLIDSLRLVAGMWWNLYHLRGTLRRRSRAGVTAEGESRAWARVAKKYFMWQLVKRGERVRFVDTRSSSSTLSKQRHRPNV